MLFRVLLYAITSLPVTRTIPDQIECLRRRVLDLSPAESLSLKCFHLLLCVNIVLLPLNLLQPARARNLIRKKFRSNREQHASHHPLPISQAVTSTGKGFELLGVDRVLGKV